MWSTMVEQTTHYLNVTGLKSSLVHSCRSNTSHFYNKKVTQQCSLTSLTNTVLTQIVYDFFFKVALLGLYQASVHSQMPLK